MRMEGYDGKNRDANDITREYLDSILVEQRIVDAVLPDIHAEIFGETFDTPVMTPAFSHLKAFSGERENAMIEYARAAKECKALNWFGMESDEIAEQIFRTGAKSIRIIKPFADKQKILNQIAFSQAQGAFAVGVDVDHVFGYDGQYDVVDGELMGPVFMDDLKRYAASTSLPFIVKGVLSVTDAVKCAACGAKGIVVSHHHGRLPYAVPPLKVLPLIAEALAGTGVTIFVDCHIDSGVDAFKALALGADAVSIGRSMMEPLQKNGVEGVVKKIQKTNEELTTILGYTGCAALRQASPDLLWID